jgi:hypothetical protein
MNYKRILVYVIVHLSFIRELGRSFFFVAKVFFNLYSIALWGSSVFCEKSFYFFSYLPDLKKLDP